MKLKCLCSDIGLGYAPPQEYKLYVKHRIKPLKQEKIPQKNNVRHLPKLVCLILSDNFKQNVSTLFCDVTALFGIITKTNIKTSWDRGFLSQMTFGFCIVSINWLFARRNCIAHDFGFVLWLLLNKWADKKSKQINKISRKLCAWLIILGAEANKYQFITQITTALYS